MKNPLCLLGIHLFWKKDRTLYRKTNFEIYLRTCRCGKHQEIHENLGEYPNLGNFPQVVGSAVSWRTVTNLTEEEFQKRVSSEKTGENKNVR